VQKGTDESEKKQSEKLKVRKFRREESIWRLKRKGSIGGGDEKKTVSSRENKKKGNWGKLI